MLCLIHLVAMLSAKQSRMLSQLGGFGFVSHGI